MATHFLSLDDLSPPVLQQLVARGLQMKHADPRELDGVLRGKTLAMIFTKSSTRTRASFEIGMRQLGGGTLNMNPEDTQIGRGEPIRDTARVLSSMADGIMVRTDAHAEVEQFAQYSSVPVINGLTDDVHPCQLLADLQTLLELRGGYTGCRVAWVGDGNNVCHSWMNAARLFDFQLAIATPQGFAPDSRFIEKNNAVISLTYDPREAVRGADVVVTDTWASMGQEGEKSARESAFKGFCVDEKLMSLAHKDALFMHCLPAYRGKEVSEAVLEGPQSVVFTEAENRLHAQKALLEFLLS
jgi:ornithine carbamoyltransferase